MALKAIVVTGKKIAAKLFSLIRRLYLRALLSWTPTLDSYVELHFESIGYTISDEGVSSVNDDSINMWKHVIRNMFERYQIDQMSTYLKYGV